MSDVEKDPLSLDVVDMEIKEEEEDDDEEHEEDKDDDENVDEQEEDKDDDENVDEDEEDKDEEEDEEKKGEREIKEEKESIQEFELALVDVTVVIPAVYTTRLEDMCIFNRRLDGLTIETITDRILIESKPVTPVPFDTPKPRNHYKNEAAFNKVMTKLNEINNIARKSVNNTIVKEENLENNTDLNIESKVFDNSIVTIKIEDDADIDETNSDLLKTIKNLKPIKEFNNADNTIVTIKIEDDEEIIQSNNNLFNTIGNNTMAEKDKNYREIVKKNKELLRMCKPLKIVLERILPCEQASKTKVPKLVPRTFWDEGLQPRPAWDQVPKLTPSSAWDQPLKPVPETSRVYTPKAKPEPPRFQVAKPTLESGFQVAKPVTEPVNKQQNIGQNPGKWSSISSMDSAFKTYEDMTSEHKGKFGGGPNCLKNIVLMFVDNNGEVDGYCLDSTGAVAEFLMITVNDDYESIVRTTKTNNFVKIMCCCWFKREEVIQELCIKLIPHATAKFMRKPHKCFHEECKCCCRNKKSGIEVSVSTVDMTKEVTSLKTEPLSLAEELSDISNKAQIIIDSNQKESYWLKELLKSNDTSTLINKALSYTRPKCKEITTKCATNTPVDILFLKNHMNNEINCYELAQEGNIVTYVREKWSRDSNYMQTESAVLQRVSAKYIKRTLIEVACCWHSLEKCMKKITDTLKLSKPSTFMKNPHNCPIGSCSCCCNPAKNTKILPSMSKISLPEHKRYGKNYVQRKEPQKSKHIQKKCPVTAPGIVTTKDASTSYKARPPISTALQQQKSMEPQPIPDTSSATQNSVVDSLISTILNRFQDVRLTINDDGKVAAALSTPVNKLSTAELKVLANILSHAQEQVKALGLRPGTNLNQHVNVNQNILNTIKSDSLIATPPSLKPNHNILNPANVSMQPILHLNNTFLIPNNINANLMRPQQTNFVPVSVANTNTSVPITNTPVQDIYKSFSNLMYKKTQSFTNSFQNHTQKSTEPSQHFAPRIENVFSLQESENNSQQLTGSKRKSENQVSKQNNKIRIMSPTKLGATTTQTQPLLLGNGLQMDQSNTSEVGTSTVNQPLPFIMVDTGSVEGMSSNNILQQMLIHGTNLARPNFTGAFPQQFVLTPTIPVSNTTNPPGTIMNTGINYGTVYPSPVQTLGNIQMMPLSTQFLPQPIFSVNQSPVDNNAQLKPVLINQQSNKETSSLRQYRPAPSSTKTTQIEIEIDPVKIESDHSDDSSDNNAVAENMATDETVVEDELKLELEEGEESTCILGM